jgi:hypothetical protein
MRRRNWDEREMTAASKTKRRLCIRKGKRCIKQINQGRSDFGNGIATAGFPDVYKQT